MAICACVLFHVQMLTASISGFFKREILKIKKAAAAKGANAIILNQFYDDAAAEDGHPITLAAYFVKYAREVTEEDKVKIEEYAEIERLRNARN